MTGTAVAQWLSYCATNQKVTGFIQDGVMAVAALLLLLLLFTTVITHFA
jgi:hypothetical protein